MGRNRLPDDERKERISLRLPKGLIDKIKKMGSIQSIIEKILSDYFRRK
jgi:hypothetical protein